MTMIQEYIMYYYVRVYVSFNAQTRVCQSFFQSLNLQSHKCPFCKSEHYILLQPVVISTKMTTQHCQHLFPQSSHSLSCMPAAMLLHRVFKVFKSSATPAVKATTITSWNTARHRLLRLSSAEWLRVNKAHVCRQNDRCADMRMNNQDEGETGELTNQDFVL